MPDQKKEEGQPQEPMMMRSKEELFASLDEALPEYENVTPEQRANITIRMLTLEVLIDLRDGLLLGLANSGLLPVEDDAPEQPAKKKA